MTDYTNLSKAELIEEIGRLRKNAALERANSEIRLLQDMKALQIGLETQNHELLEARQQLEEARDRYADLYDFAPAGYLSLDENGLIQQINLTGAAMLGQPRADLIGKPFSACLNKGDHQNFFQYLHQTCAHSGNTVAEVTLGHNQKDVRLESTAMAATAGQPRSCRTIMIDIADRRQARLALQESERNLRFALEGAGDGMWDWDIQTGKALFSAHYKTMLGHAEDEIENHFNEWETRLHPEDKPRTKACLQAFLDGSGSSYTSEFRLKCKNGKWKWILARGIAVDRDAAGKPLRMIGTHSDISNTKSLIEKLQQSHDLLVDLSEQVPGFVHQYRLFPDGRSCFPVASAGIRDIFELTPEQVRNDASPLFDRVHPEDRDGLWAALQQSARTEQPCQHEFRVILPKQGVGWRLEGARPERLDDGSVLWHGFIIDIGSIREAKQQAMELLRQNRLIMQSVFNLQEEESRHLARDLHDDLGQWLTAIQAEAEVILGLTGNEQNPVIHASALAINRSAAEVHKTIRAMLHRLRPSLLDTQGLADSLRELVTQWRKRHPGIACDLMLDGDLTNFREDLMIAIYRIVQEALTNITRHAQASQVAVKLRRSEDGASATHSLRLTIEDDGIGMSPGSQPKGLGLLGMRERAAAANGHLELYSSPRHGTRIEVQLPLAISRRKNHGK